MSRLFLLILLAASSDSEEDSCQDIDKPPNPTSDCCGIHLASDDLEKSGDAGINQFPWLALIENDKGSFYATGSLITSRHVLTAAQITYRKPKRVILGEFNKTHFGPDCVTVEDKKICNDGAITVDIETFILHPEFPIHQSRKYNGHDIAVLKLADIVPYNEFIRPICLPTSDVLVSPPDNLRFINAGWGTKPVKWYRNIDIKHYVSLPYVDLKKCKETYLILNISNFQVKDSHVCAGGEKGLDTCRGDAGGPLMLKENGHYTLVGILSFGSTPCGIEGIPSVYTKVYNYLTWINNAIVKL